MLYSTGFISGLWNDSYKCACCACHGRAVTVIATYSLCANVLQVFVYLEIQMNFVRQKNGFSANGLNSQMLKCIKRYMLLNGF